MYDTMRSKPWANGYSVPTHNNTTSLEQQKSTDMHREFGVQLPPLSQVDCLGLHRVDVDALTKDHNEKMTRLRNRHKTITTVPRNEREFGFGRRKKKNPDFPDGKVPPISQIVMGSQHEAPWWQPTHPKRNVNATRLLPISQVSCLTYSHENEHPKPKKELRSKFEIHDTDSEYVKLAKTGGQPNLLHYVEAKPPLKRTIENGYYPETNGSLQGLKSESVTDPTWKPSQWGALSPIKKAEH